MGSLLLLISIFALARTQGDMPDLSSMMGGMGGGGGGMGDMASMMGGMGGGGMGDMASMMGGMGGGKGGKGGMPGMGGGDPPGEPFPAVKSDVKFILCSTCKLLARRVHSESSKWGPQITRSEEALQSKLSEMCDPASDAGSWIAEYDMVENSNGKTIDLKRQSAKGECEVECNTIKEACKGVLQEADVDLAGQLFKAFKAKKPLDAKALKEKMCTSDDAWAGNVEGGCAAGVPKIPKKRKAGPAFKEKIEFKAPSIPDAAPMETDEEKESVPKTDAVAQDEL